MQLTVPKELTALMSAIRMGSHVCSTNPDKMTFKFEQKVYIARPYILNMHPICLPVVIVYTCVFSTQIPIPTCLVAIVVGALESK